MVRGRVGFVCVEVGSAKPLGKGLEQVLLLLEDPRFAPSEPVRVGPHQERPSELGDVNGSRHVAGRHRSEVPESSGMRAVCRSGRIRSARPSAFLQMRGRKKRTARVQKRQWRLQGSKALCPEQSTWRLGLQCAAWTYKSLRGTDCQIE